MKKYLRGSSRSWADYAAIIGAVASFSVMFQSIASLWGKEAIVASVALAAAAIAGATSLSVARAVKSISAHKRIFISYSYEQKEIAQKLRDALMEQGAVVWLDVNDLQPGSDLNASINSAIESSNTVVAILSQRMGTHVSKELQSAFARNVPVIAVMPPNADRPSGLEAAKKVLYLDANTNIEAVASTALHS